MERTPYMISAVERTLRVTGPGTRLSRSHAEQAVRPLLLSTAEAISASLGGPGALEPGRPAGSRT